MSTNVAGTVYLIHFDQPIGTTGRGSARHYIGWTNGITIAERLAEHRAGRGARILAWCNEVGISYDVVRTWNEVDRFTERRFKNAGHFDLKCPACNEGSRT